MLCVCVKELINFHYKPHIQMSWPIVHIMQSFYEIFKAEITERETIDWHNSKTIVVCRRALNNSIINDPHSSIRICTLNIITQTLFNSILFRILFRMVNNCKYTLTCTIQMQAITWWVGLKSRWYYAKYN